MSLPKRGRNSLIIARTLTQTDMSRLRRRLVRWGWGVEHVRPLTDVPALHMALQDEWVTAQVLLGCLARHQHGHRHHGFLGPVQEDSRHKERARNTLVAVEREQRALYNYTSYATSQMRREPG
jgi:hypothetical protein